MHSCTEICQSCLPPNKQIKLLSLLHVLNCHYSRPQLSNYKSPSWPVMAFKPQSTDSVLRTLIASHSVKRTQQKTE